MPSVYVVGGYSEYIRMFLANGWDVTATPEEAEFLQFCGGEDVSPSFYGEEPHPTTRFNPERDRKEKELFDKYRGQKNFLGICRGAQFLCVMSGGKLWQHVEKHGIYGTHDVLDLASDTVYQCSSTHHQMMRTSHLFEEEKVVTVGVAPFVVLGENEILDCGTILQWGEEVNFFPETKALCFQPHPEYMGKEHECQKYYFSCIQRFF